MLNYSAQIKPEDRWAIAAYIRVLQVSQDAHFSDVPPADRGNIREPQMPSVQPGAETKRVGPTPAATQDTTKKEEKR
jgi:hypothetical protein